MSGEIGSIYGPRIPTTRERIDFYHGIDFDDNSQTYEEMLEILWQRQAWIKDKYGDDAFEDKPLMEGYSSFDLEDNGYTYNQYRGLLKPDDLKRVHFLLKQQEAEHDENHFVRLRPFCPKCRHAMEIARLSLCSWMLRFPGRPVPDSSDAALPWDTEQIPVKDDSSQAELYMTPDELSKMPRPKDLIDGILPRRGVGYITGRDRSLKTFFALDIAMHIASKSYYWHVAPKLGEESTTRRKLNWAHKGVAIFAAGEGVNSFAPRMDAWVAAQHIKGPVNDEYTTIDGENSIKYPACKLCQAEKDDYVGHVNYLEWDEPDVVTVDNYKDHRLLMVPGFGQEANDGMIIRRGTPNLFAGGDDYRYLLAKARSERPDVIVLDTLALSSGSADQQAAVDMGIIHENARRLAEAAECVVLIIAHTDKGDNDARGSSVIEDNADFVLHCSRPDNDYVEVKVAKRKDADDNWSFRLGVEIIELPTGESSLILRDWDGETFDIMDDPEQEKIEDVIHAMETVVVGSGRNGVDVYVVVAELLKLGKTSRQRVSELLHKAQAQGRVAYVDRPGKRTLWYMPADWVEFQRRNGYEIAGLDDPVG